MILFYNEIKMFKLELFKLILIFQLLILRFFEGWLLKQQADLMSLEKAKQPKDITLINEQSILFSLNTLNGKGVKNIKFERSKHDNCQIYLRYRNNAQFNKNQRIQLIYYPLMNFKNKYNLLALLFIYFQFKSLFTMPIYLYFILINMESQMTQDISNKLKISQSQSQPLAFIIDIDGTIIISHKQIQGSSQAINFLSSNNLPYLFLTNNVSHSEQTLARDLNTMLKLQELIRPQQVILNYTPTRDIIDWENINVLLIGRQTRFNEILPLNHIPKYVTIEEYCTIFPDDIPLGRRKFDEWALQIKKNVQRRLGLQQVTKKTLKFGAILILCCPVNWQQSIQVIMDILNSPDGHFPLEKKSYSYQKTHIPIFVTNNDILYMVSKCNIPRILIRPFNRMVKDTFKEIFGCELDMKVFGKPEIQTFRYTERHCEKLFGKIEKYVMIGDNPQIDIEGAVNAGWDGILFKSGVATHDLPSAKINTSNLLQGIKQYLTKYHPNIVIPQ